MALRNLPDEEPHIVEDYYIGNTHIMIADNYCVSKEDAEKIMDRLAQKLLPKLIETYRKQGVLEEKCIRIEPGM